MIIQTHHHQQSKIAEIQAQGRIIDSTSNATELLGDLYYQEYDSIILYEANITPEFFDLKNGMAGEILQKFSNFRMRLTIVGNFTKYPGKSLQDFIRESNKGRHIQFVDSLEKALAALSF